jgi:hypothetical protein
MSEQQDREYLEMLGKNHVFKLEALKIIRLEKTVGWLRLISIQLVLILGVLLSMAWKYR